MASAPCSRPKRKIRVFVPLCLAEDFEVVYMCSTSERTLRAVYVSRAERFRVWFRSSLDDP